MSFTDDELIEKYPFAYHVTAAENLETLGQSGRLRSAASLLAEGGRRDLLRTHRKGQTRLQIGKGAIVIRDQAPLAPGALDLTDGSTLSDYIEYLNDLVYLWPGTAKQPKGGALTLGSIERVGASVILRFAVSMLLRANPGVELRFARYNAGAARHHPKIGKAKRRVGLHQNAASFEWSLREVTEMAVKGEVALPPNTSFARSVDGPWLPLYPVEGVDGASNT